MNILKGKIVSLDDLFVGLVYPSFIYGAAETLLSLPLFPFLTGVLPGLLQEAILSYLVVATVAFDHEGNAFFL